MPCCSETINPLLNPQGDRCTACGHPFLRSFVNFEHLPLVRFQPSRDISIVECLHLIRQACPPRTFARHKEPQDPWSNDGPDVQTWSLAGDAEAAENAAMDFDDPFTKLMLDFEPTGRFAPPTVTREMLLLMESTDVFVVQWGTSARARLPPLLSQKRMHRSKACSSDTTHIAARWLPCLLRSRRNSTAT